MKLRQKCYERMESIYTRYCGYIKTTSLLKEGFSNRQIQALQQLGLLEKIANGSFWMPDCGREKPADYKAVEVCLVNPDAVIIADSACYYQGFIDVEPEVLSVGTRRSDRHQMRFPFPTTRHYLSDACYRSHIRIVNTVFGNYQIYNIDRSVCDCILFEDSIDKDIFDLVMETYLRNDADMEMLNRMQSYIKQMKMTRSVTRAFRDVKFG